MANTLQGVLANIPGYGGYLAQKQFNEQQGLDELKQAGGAMSLVDLLRKQKQAEAERAYLAQPEVQAKIQAGDIKGAISGAPQLGLDQILKLGELSRKEAGSFTGAGKGILNTATGAVQPNPYPTEQNPSNLLRLQNELMALPPDQRAAHFNAIRKESETPKQISPTVVMPSAPTLSELVDPKDPSRLLKIDAKTYKGGTLGDVGVFGIAGKEPSAAKREEKSAEGKDLLVTELDNLREHYRVLNEARAIPSSERGTASNVGAWVQSSTPGQILGRMGGTKEQDARNQIQSSRLRILNAIKSATGMSAQQLNSNIELRTWLDSLTSLSNTYESNIGIIDSIEETFLKNKEKTPSPERRKTDLPPPGAVRRK